MVAGSIFVIFVPKIRFIVMPRLISLFFVCFLMGNSLVFSQHYSRVLFDNSVLPGNYGYSQVSYSGFSWVENVKGRMPLVDSLSFTPNNALSLKYTSSIRGLWEATVFFPENKHYFLNENEEILTFRMYLMPDFDLQALPNIALMQGDTCTKKITIQNSQTDGLLVDQWVQVRIPLSHFVGFDAGEAVSGLVFYQGGATGLEVVNHLLIDQIEFLPLNLPNTDLNYAAVLNQVTGYERHVEVEWQLPLDPAIRFVKIYRSVDGENFEEIAIRPILLSNYIDIVPASNRDYYYKISWLDQRYAESPFSKILMAETKPINNEMLLDAVQAAHINYFDKWVEFNSGMHKEDYFSSEAVVNVEDTGYGLLANTIGAAKGLISNRIYLRRVENMVTFLSGSAEQYYGAFPLLLDGRSGKGVYAQDTAAIADVKATASLMQGLLVARNYLKERLAIREEEGSPAGNEGSMAANIDERIKGTIEGIDKLWRNVQWTQFATGDSVLMDTWSPQTGFEQARPMGGFGADMLSYFLALASPTYALGPDAYTKGLAIKRDFIGLDSLDQRKLYSETPMRSDTLLYGYFLDVGSLNQNLMEAYASFLAFNPMGKRDQFADYGLSLTRLIHAYKRRDNEMNAGNSASEIWGTAQEDAYSEYLPSLVPAISASGFAFAPDVSLPSIRSMYLEYGNVLFTEFGFRNWINIHDHRISATFEGLNQAAIPVMIENGRSGLIWRLFMSHEDIQRMTQTYFQAN